MLVFLWLLTLPLLVLFYAMLVERAVTGRGAAIVLALLLGLPLALGVESWRVIGGHIDERKHRDRRGPAHERRAEDRDG